MQKAEANAPAGVLAASLTPLGEDGAADAKALAVHVRHLLSSGCDGVLLFGTTGEAASFSVEERMDTLDGVLERDVPPERLLVGTGCCAVPDTVRLTRHATRRGVAGVLVVPPFYYKSVSEDGVFAAYDRVVQDVGERGLRLFLYHIPQMSGVPVTPALVERLAAAYPEQVTGLKDSAGDFAHTERLVQRFPALQIFAGSERFLLPTLQAGGAGCISATVNITSRLAGGVYARWQAGEADEEAQARLTARREAIEAYPLIPALKHLMSERTGHEGWRCVRPPLVPFPEAAAACLKTALGALGS